MKHVVSGWFTAGQEVTRFADTCTQLQAYKNDTSFLNEGKNCSRQTAVGQEEAVRHDVR